MRKKAQLSEESVNLLLWIIFIIAAGAGIYFVLRKLLA